MKDYDLEILKYVVIYYKGEFLYKKEFGTYETALEFYKAARAFSNYIGFQRIDSVIPYDC